MVGFGLSALGGWAVGVAIDAAGGANSAHGWTAAFLVMGGGILLGPLALWWSRARTGTLPLHYRSRRPALPIVVTPRR